MTYKVKSDRLDAKLVKGQVNILDIARGYSDLKRNGAEHIGLCPVHDEDTPSFRVNEHKQSWHCFGCGNGGDVLELIQMAERVDFQTALAIAVGDREIDTGFRLGGRVFAPTHKVVEEEKVILKSSLPIPKHAKHFKPGPVEWDKAPWVFNPRKNKFSRWNELNDVYAYRSVDRQILGYVLRKEFDEELPDGGTKRKKITPAVVWSEFVHDGEVKQGWALVKFGEDGNLKPLYGQEDLVGNNMPVMAVEGEKAAKSGRLNLKQARTVTWPGGTNGVVDGRTGKFLIDIRPLGGKRVIYWPDADFGGFRAALDWGQHCLAQGVSQFFIVDPPMDVEKGWDLADAFKEGWSEKDVIAYVQDNLYTIEKFAERYALEVPDVSNVYPHLAQKTPANEPQ